MSNPPAHPTGLLQAAFADDAARPLVTFYDDGTGERIELSVKTFGNWVAKTANLLVDGLGAEPGERVVLALPPHWQSVVWLFGCWSAGVVPVPAGDLAVLPADAAPDIVVASEPDLGTALERYPAAREIVGLSLHPLGGALTDPAPAVVDYAVEVRAYGDEFVPITPVTGASPALALPGGPAVLSGTELAAAAAAAVRDWGLPERARVLTTVGFHTLDGILAGLLAPLSVSGSVIICRNLDALDQTGLERRVTMEHVTAVAGVTAGDWASRSGHGLLSLPSGADGRRADPANGHERRVDPTSEQ